MGLIYFILSIFLSLILIPVGFAFGLFKQVYHQQFFKSFKILDKKFTSMAMVIDRYGNVVCGELLNATLIKADSKFLFGNPNETISSCIGRNKQVGSLTKTGKCLDSFLSYLDRNHSIKNIGY